MGSRPIRADLALQKKAAAGCHRALDRERWRSCLGTSVSAMQERLSKVIVAPELPIHLAVAAMDRVGLGVLLLCGEDRTLVGVLTDGDIRRAIMHNVSFDKPSSAIASRAPLTAEKGVRASEALRRMNHGRSFKVNHLPIVDSRRHVVGLLVRSDLMSNEDTGLSAVIMAGGYGRRLAPLTDDVPKPMLPLGDRPVMERIIDRLRDSGIRRVNVTTHYRPDAIARHFGDGSEFGVRIKYVNEESPLGTAGALALLDAPDEPFLVINGDVVCDVDFRAILAFHREHQADLTVAVRPHTIRIPFGVFDAEGPNIVAIREKPILTHLVNAGIYLLEPSVYPHLPTSGPFDMTDLIHRLIEGKRRVVGFPIHEYWRDIGRHDEYAQAQVDLSKGGCVL